MVKSFTTSQTQLASTARSHKTLTDNKPDSPRPSSVPPTPNPSVFLGVALGMAWQLAVVVLVPIVGGYKLDERVGSAPWLTLLGFVLAMAATVFVIRRALSLMENASAVDSEKDKHE